MGSGKQWEGRARGVGRAEERGGLIVMIMREEGLGGAGGVPDQGVDERGEGIPRHLKDIHE